MAVITANVKALAAQSVICWLATADEHGQPNVSPKEIFTVADDEHIIIANIASPGTAKNLHINAKVCVSFIDIFLQKGFKVYGIAHNFKPSEAAYLGWIGLLRPMVGDRFPIHSLFVVRATAVEPIIAPSYRFYPTETTEESQIQAALRTYGVYR